MKNTYLKFPNVYFLLTIILGGLPFLIYFVERKFNILTTSEIWYSSGTNHGPWRWGVEGFTISYPIIILLIVTLITFFSKGIKNKRWILILAGLSLVIAQIIILFIQIYFLSWTID